MGVNDLWQILEPVKQHIDLHNLVGKSIAVDLSLWVCEAQTVKKMIGTVMKPHLRNLFFRISYLTQMDVKLVFVMEGEPPKLKADVISKRNQIRYGPSGKTWSQKRGRSQFKSVLRECLDMLECLGIPWVQAAGEAEAMCAYLNACGYVDGCLTNDGDAFLYGAQTVYRNFTMNTKDPHVDCYTMSCIKDKLGLDRDALVGLAILLGCDYLPKVIEEFLSSKDKLGKIIRYQRPDLLLFQRFTLEKMEWPNHYACEKLLVLLTRYDMIERKLGRKNSNQLQPVRIVKTRIRNGVHCFEIEWEKPEHYVVDDKQCGELGLLTVEEESLFEAAYPEIVTDYQKQKLEIKGKKQKSTKIKSEEKTLPESDSVLNFQSCTNLKPICEIFPKQNSQLNLEISPEPTLPQESSSASLNGLLLPEDTHCLNMQEQISSPRPFAIQQITAVSNSLILESGQPNTSSHNTSVIANLHLSTIDWEGTSFSNSPALERNTFSHGLNSKHESELSTIPYSHENNSEQLSHESERCTSNITKVLDWNLQRISPEDHLLSGITDLYLQDLPLKERILRKLSCPQDNVQPDVDLKTLSLPRVKESGVARNISDSPLHLSKDLPGICLQNEFRNSKVLKGDQLLQENYKVNFPVHYPVSKPAVETSNVRVRLAKTTLDCSRKIDVQTTQKIVTKKSVCLDRHSSDEESAPVFEKAKYATQKMKHSSKKHNSTQFKENNSTKLKNPKIHIKETEQCAKSYKTPGNEENYFPDPAKSSLNFLQCPKKGKDSSPCLDSPLPLWQRLKLRLQST
ncbi:Flap endonuclease GEN like protein 1 [Tupaia chinensis]|uniref:Flap endonuclease GEN like protein 1 n=1 Tax=Tupaia chinensis TaxID=246437 RepID=L9LAV2_TUPCH|nr:Flap endonuclease GEN like protein 1 [Tupaia chinensis]